MSLIRLGCASTRRQMAQPPVGGVAPQGAAPPETARPADEEASEALPTPPPTGDAVATKAETDTSTERALEQLIQYFPAETMTFFLSAVSFRAAFGDVEWVEDIGPWTLIGAFTILTPLVVLLVAFATFREEKHLGTFPPGRTFFFPLFDMVAAAIAFFIWSLAVPGLFEPSASGTTSMVTHEMAQVMAAFLGFFASWALSQIRKIIGPQKTYQ